MKKINVTDYYDPLPPADHSPGDIWSGLPTHGLFQSSHVRGIVVTPACDLSNRKVETISYLPILSAYEWFHSVSFHSDISSVVNDIIASISSARPETQTSGFRLPRYPTSDDVSKLKTIAEAEAENRPNGPHYTRLAAAISHFDRLHSKEERRAASLENISRIFKKEKWNDLLSAVAKNSRTDCYFLPKDEQDIEWSGLPDHGLVLFRYPLTVPIEILDAATDMSCLNWEAYTRSTVDKFPIAQSFEMERPIKRIRLKGTFMADLISRYIAVYSRLGAPDLSPGTVDRYAREIGGAT